MKIDHFVKDGYSIELYKSMNIDDLAILKIYDHEDNNIIVQITKEHAKQLVKSLESFIYS